MDNADPKLETSIERLRHQLRQPTSSLGPGAKPARKSSFPPVMTQKNLHKPATIEPAWPVDVLNSALQLGQ